MYGSLLVQIIFRITFRKAEKKDVTPWRNVMCAVRGKGPESKQHSLQLPVSPAALVSLSEIAAFRFITDSKGNGINLIKDAYRFYCDDPEVVESICVLINEMAQYGKTVVLLVQSLPPPPERTNSEEAVATQVN